MKEKVIPFPTPNPTGYNAAAEKTENIIGKRIAEARKERGFSQASFSRYLRGCGVDVTTGALGKWETGATVPSAYQMIGVCAALGLAEHLPYFMKNYTPSLNEEGRRKVEDYRADLIASGKYKPEVRQQRRIHYIEMPVSDLKVSAGNGAFLDDGSFEMVSFPEERVPEGADFGIRVSGDSMEPVYHDGQIVWVQECDRVSPGQVGVFIYDGEGYLKRYEERMPEEEDAEEFTDSYGMVHPQPVLESYNPKYEPRPVSPSAMFRVVGKVL